MAALAVISAYGRISAGECVTVTLHGTEQIPVVALAVAEQTASQTFRDIGVSLYWRISASEPVSEACAEIGVRFTSDSQAAFHPGALAYALPYQAGGVRIGVFANRVLRCGSDRQNGLFLGQVRSHEIGHTLEGIGRHSREGLMKAHWSSEDLGRMFAHPLRFAGEDAELIHLGFLTHADPARQGAR